MPGSFLINFPIFQVPIFQVMLLGFPIFQVNCNFFLRQKKGLVGSDFSAFQFFKCVNSASKKKLSGSYKLSHTSARSIPAGTNIIISATTLPPLHPPQLSRVGGKLSSPSPATVCWHRAHIVNEMGMVMSISIHAWSKMTDRFKETYQGECTLYITKGLTYNGQNLFSLVT